MAVAKVLLILLQAIGSFLNRPFWNGIVGIGTLLLALVSYLSIGRMNRMRRMQKNREMINKVYSPLIQSLREISNEIKNLNFATWEWEIIKKEEPYLAYQVSESLFDRLDSFSKKKDAYDGIRRDLRGDMEKMLVRIFNEKVVTDKTIEGIDSIVYPLPSSNSATVHWGINNIFKNFFEYSELIPYEAEEGVQLQFITSEQERETRKVSKEEMEKVDKVLSNKAYLFRKNLFSREKYQKVKELYAVTEELQDRIKNLIAQIAKKAK